jgi:hypothetical protein
VFFIHHIGGGGHYFCQGREWGAEDGGVWEIFKVGYFQGERGTGRERWKRGKAVKKRDKV